MVYWLVIPISFYAALAAYVLSRRPRAISNTLAAVYTLASAAVTAAYLVLGTTPDRALAEAAAWIIVVVSALHLVLLPPLILISLYYESWFRDHVRELLAVSISVTVIITVLYQAIRPADIPLVYPVGEHTWIHWSLGRMFSNWRLAITQVFLSQIFIVPISAILIRNRVMRLQEAVWLLALSVGSRLISLLSPLAGADALVPVTALNLVPLVGLIAVLVLRSSRSMTLDALIQGSLHSHHDAVVVLDSRRRVIWRNTPSLRWLPDGGANTLANPYLLDILRGTPLLLPVRHLLDSGQTVAECQMMHDGEEYILQIELQYLSNLQTLAGAQLLILRDITASRMRRDLQERSRELLALSAISVDIASSLNPDQVIGRALEQIALITRANALGVFLFDPGNPLLLKRAGQRILGEKIISLPEEYRIDPSATANPVNVVMRSGKSFSLSDTEQGPYGQRIKDLGMRAAALVPLQAGDRVIGMLLVTYLETHDFDRIETALLESVARQLAVAIDNARLHVQERRQRQIAEVLREAASLLGNTPQDLALETLLGLLRDIMDYDRASVLLVAEPGKLRVAAYQGFSATMDQAEIESVRIEINAYGYLKRLFDERTPQIVSDTHVDAMWQPGAFSYGSWIGAPLIVHDQVTGCLSLSHHERGRFSDDDLRIAAAFAAQVAIAAETTRLFETEQRRRVQAELMQQATHDLVSSPNLESALEAALRNLATMLPFDQAQIGLIDESSQTWFSRAGLRP